jgi:hypothetical protein
MVGVALAAVVIVTQVMAKRALPKAEIAAE